MRLWWCSGGTWWQNKKFWSLFKQITDKISSNGCENCFEYFDFCFYPKERTHIHTPKRGKKSEMNKWTTVIGSWIMWQNINGLVWLSRHILYHSWNIDKNYKCELVHCSVRNNVYVAVDFLTHWFSRKVEKTNCIPSHSSAKTIK